MVGYRPYQICNRCVLDTTGDPSISFDESCICNYCREYDATVVSQRIPPALAERKLRETIAEVKNEGRNRKYDCIMGLSGGADSSYIAYLAMEHGLRPLAVHLDNSWDTELAVKNIENILKKTGFDYYNYVVDWEEFKDLQLAYLKASVIDIEVVTDQAIFALLHQFACKLNIRYILLGDNPATERVMPRGWVYRKNDLSNMLAIHRKFGKVRLQTYPLMGLYDQRYYSKARGIRYINLLHYVPYDYEQVRKLLAAGFGWRDYEWKHCESFFTKFYQGYILPKKFNVDKRKAHLSDLILSGQITREVALETLQRHYYDEVTLKNDYDYVLSKLGLSGDEFDAIMALPIVPHEAFPQDQLGTWHRIKLIFWMCLHNPFGLVKLALDHHKLRYNRAS